LRGRSLTFEVFPLSFAEYLEFKDIVSKPSHPDSESVVRGALEQYLRWGGLPEVVLAEEALRPLILGEYASLMLYRDVVERYNVRNEILIRELLRFVFRNTASLVNVSKLHRDFVSLGFSVSKNTLHEYLGYLEDSFLVFLLPKQERSLRKQAHNPKKLHVIDPGLVMAFQGNPDRDVGRKLETTVFLHVRRRLRALYYYANGVEVDLCDEECKVFWNTCWSLSDADTVQREIRSMQHGKTRNPQANGVLLYHEFDPSLKSTITEAQPAWRWLLSQSNPEF
jgi:predicted AAA+ superfamily ATPase